ncbi:MAG TPA: SDR family NAD(P)-dependent oxidoreductase, partial [Deltaproteobacteria bacterium]|nr:SDR family NAD(P)-dependent oxidoreductase [Deltaproteobacteria bacterium]
MLDGMADRSGVFRQSYGPFAVVVGASEGLGAAFAQELASRGMDLLLLARRKTLLERLAAEIRSHHGVEVRCLPIDVVASDLGQQIEEAIRDLEVGLLVYNAAFAPVGPFLERSDDELRRVAAVNMVGPMLFVRRLAPAMCRR